MQAVVQTRYGPPAQVLEYRQIEPPSAADDEVIVRVHAAGLHVGDTFGVRGAPLPLRAVTGWRRPKYGVPGLDIAGTVEAVGANVPTLRPGDEVYGVCKWPAGGGCAEYAVAAQQHLVVKPAHLSFEEAAAIPTSGLAALHGLRDAGKVQPGHRVLINGASGGVGTFAVQIAKALAADVTGVCSSANVELVGSLGADQVVDYTRDDFTRRADAFDVILDNIENRTLSDVRRVLAPRGTLVLNSGTGATGLKMLLRFVRPIVAAPFTRQRLRRYLSNPNPADLAVLNDLVEDKKVRPVIDRTYQLQDAPAALEYIEAGHARGKVVVVI